ncbi:hypothetical protein [Leptodesmis sp.]|uniref:hypothetical protein n=1 Tax=Leptodesmis sp. TaxID=3100501 RepID=UPI00405357B5
MSSFANLTSPSQTISKVSGKCNCSEPGRASTLQQAAIAALVLLKVEIALIEYYQRLKDH